MTRDDMATMAKLLARMSALVDTLASLSADTACSLIGCLPRCTIKQCTNPATVQHSIVGILACDACCARAVVVSGRNLTQSTDDTNIVRASLAQEGMWEDVPHAERIRRLHEYVQVVTKDAPTTVH